MPDAARLIAAVSLALIAFIVSGQVMAVMEEITDFGYFTYVNILLGVLCGWIVMGKRAGKGWGAAVNNGMTGVAALLFWGLFVQGVYAMVQNALRNRYDGPFEAILDSFKIGIEYGFATMTVTILTTLLVGGILSGLATEYAWRQWR